MEQLTQEQIALAILNGQNVTGQPVCVVTHYHAEPLTQPTPNRITITCDLTPEQIAELAALPWPKPWTGPNVGGTVRMCGPECTVDRTTLLQG